VTVAFESEVGVRRQFKVQIFGTVRDTYKQTGV